MIGGRITLVGVSSLTVKDVYGAECSSNVPSGFARISNQLKWIRESMDVADWECGGIHNGSL